MNERKKSTHTEKKKWKDTARIQRKTAYADNEGKTEKMCRENRAACLGVRFQSRRRRRLSLFVQCIARIASCSDDRLARFLSYTNIFMTVKRVICVQMIETHWSLLLRTLMMMLWLLWPSSSSLLLLWWWLFFFLFWFLWSLVSNRILVLRISLSSLCSIFLFYHDRFFSLVSSYRMHSCQRVKSVVVFCSFASNTHERRWKSVHRLIFSSPDKIHQNI